MRAPFLNPAKSVQAGGRRLGAARGFTLVELMVAMTGGLFLTVVVFALSRDASRFYQRESRIANATMNGLSGFERLSNDVARAGHLSTPNIQQDPRVCNLPNAATWPAQLAKLRAVVIETNAPQVAGTEIQDAHDATASPLPQGIVVSGALNTPEELYTAQVGPTATGWEIYLNLATPSAARVGLSPAPAATATNAAALTSIFMAGRNGESGRIVRLRWMGMDQYAVVASVAASPGQAIVNLTSAPSLQKLKAGGGQCGVDNLGTGMSLSAIDVVRYNIRPMVDDANYAALYKASGMGTAGGPSTAPFERKRTELVRVELNAAGQEIASTREIVGEYAVDLQFSAWGATNAFTRALLAVASPTINDTYTATQLLRGIHIRFSVRSREADRDEQVVTGTGGGSSDMFRFPLIDTYGTHYARVRTLQSDVALRNLENSNW